MKAALVLDRPKSRTRTARRAGFPQLWQFATEHLVVLPLGALIGMVWANTDGERYYRIVDATSFLVNDVAMVVFFGLITKEIVEATAPGGVLHPWHD